MTRTAPIDRRTLRARLVALLTALLVLALVQTALAEGKRRGRHGPPAPGAFVERYAERLGLDDATRARITEISKRAHAEGEALHQEVRAAKRTMHDMLDADAPDRDAIMRQVEVIGEVKTRYRKHRIGTMLEIRALLTPGQRTELAEIRAERRDRWRKGRWCDERKGGPPE